MHSNILQKLINPFNPKSDCKLFPLTSTHFLLSKSQEFGVRSKVQPLPDKFKYSVYWITNGY